MFLFDGMLNCICLIILEKKSEEYFQGFHTKYPCIQSSLANLVYDGYHINSFTNILDLIVTYHIEIVLIDAGLHNNTAGQSHA